MRKFKLFFYPIYILLAFVVLYYSIDILANIDTYKEKVDFTLLRKLPSYMLYTLIVLALLMLAELVAENIHLIRLRRKLKQAQEEVLKLKARLYDRSQDEVKEEPEEKMPVTIQNEDDDDWGNESNDEDDQDDEEDETDRKSDW